MGTAHDVLIASFVVWFTQSVVTQVFFSGVALTLATFVLSQHCDKQFVRLKQR